MSGAILSTITRTPLTKTDSAHATPSNTSITQLARHYESYNSANPKNLKVVVDVPLKSHQSEVEKYLGHLSQAEAYKSDASHQAVGTTTQETVAETAVETSHEASDTVERLCFYGDFDLHTMDSQFLRNIYMGYEEPDHGALYEALTRYKATGRVDARITLRKGLWENGSAVFADIRDPKSCIPIPLRLTLVTEMAIAYTDKELDLFFDRNDHLRTNVPGIFANLGFANVKEHHCSEGKFLMNRCWARTQPDGSVVEMFEGYMEFKIKGEMYFLGGHGEDINMIEHAFWAIRDHQNKVDLNEDEGSLD
ncbi:hypothetical protein ARMGADRAFT_1168235 [Armillaria gallica]|uniref:Uncharacterized protein n=1 Tax=Armillaria gallica TaxID=47427 RepID=A0A2H3D2Q9_ARMGA|nr:hypothetical protein ARMGADRAFT_1168235 [Armillaria gallica]